MTTKFCTICGTLLSVNTDRDILTFVCQSCSQIHETQPDDTLRYEEIKGANLVVHKKLLKKIAQDPTNPKELLTCVQCSNKWVKQIRLGKNMRLVNACLNKKCNHTWISS